MIYEHRLITEWPGDLRVPTRRVAPTFRAEWTQTIQELEHELAVLKAKDIILETAHSDHDVRMDGSVNASATPLHPGVILSFESRYGPLRYYTDVFTSWRANVRAIMLGLVALRAVDRYGISGRGEQYTGFARLMAAHLAMTPTRARQVIAEMAGLDRNALLKADHDVITSMFKLAAKRCHPDAGGDKEKFQELNEAMSLLEAQQVPDLVGAPA